MNDDRRAYLAYRDRCAVDFVIPVSFDAFIKNRKAQRLAKKLAASQHAEIAREAEAA